MALWAVQASGGGWWGRGPFPGATRGGKSIHTCNGVDPPPKAQCSSCDSRERVGKTWALRPGGLRRRPYEHGGLWDGDVCGKPRLNSNSMQVPGALFPGRLGADQASQAPTPSFRGPGGRSYSWGLLGLPEFTQRCALKTLTRVTGTHRHRNMALKHPACWRP